MLNPTAPDMPPVTVRELLEALPDSAVILDATGTIVAVNHRWREFAATNGATYTATGPGISYLGVCAAAAAGGDPGAAVVLRALQDVLGGRSPCFTHDYPCPSPQADRWFSLRVGALGRHPQWVLLTHLDVTARAATEQDLLRRVGQDPLTGVSNHALFTQRLGTALLALRSPTPPPTAVAVVVVVYLDLDGFKTVNDTHGHPTGDEVLRTVAGRLTRLTRSTDTVARLGGDEFAVVAPRTPTHGHTGLRDRITHSLGQPHDINGRALVVPASVGTVLADPGDDVTSVMRRADTAMYQVKRTRRARPTTPHPPPP